jgi:RND family efflux transporter MFP subunit
MMAVSSLWQHGAARGRPLLGLASLAVLVAGGCGHGEPAARQAAPVEVIVTKAIVHEVTDYQDFTGRLSAIPTVDIRARVSGYVTEAPFKEGDLVPEGKVLFKIDDTVYAAALEKAKADVVLYEAQKRLLDAQYERNRGLLRTGAASRDDYDITVAQREQAVANIFAAKANVKTAQQNMDWTQVRAPHAGRISRRFVDPGNLVNADNTILTSLVTENPIYVYFDVDERTYLDLVDAASPGETGWLSSLQFPVLMRLANEDKFTHAGTVDFIDNQVSPTTGTLRMRGEFQNPRGTLKPGLFARVRLPVGPPYQAVLVPDEAIQSDQGRKFVYVLNDKDEVVYQKVKPGQALGALRVIKDGLAKGERVIISGMQRVRPGITVTTDEQAPPRPPASPLGGLLSFHRPSVTPGRPGDKETRRQGE